MHAAVDPLIVLVLLLNFFVLGTSRLRAAITGSALQGALLAVLVLFVRGALTTEILLVAAGAALLKAVLIPGMLLKAMRDAAIRREVEPVVGFVPTLLLGALGTGVAVIFAGTLPLAVQHHGSLLIPTALATVASGFILLVTRRQAIMQVVGYLVLENGIYIMGLTLHDAMPFLVEVGILLDLLVAIFVIGIVMNHINREFASLDVARLDTLRE